VARRDKWWPSDRNHQLITGGLQIRSPELQSATDLARRADANSRPPGHEWETSVAKENGKLSGKHQGLRSRGSELYTREHEITLTTILGRAGQSNPPVASSGRANA
jgi:hypothetical protein